MNVPLSDLQIERYSRQIILPEIGGRGQERLLAAAIAIRGVGELARTAARYLAGAGIGTLQLEHALVDGLGGQLRRLNADVAVNAGDVDAATSLVIAADLAPVALDRCARQARAHRLPLLAAARLAGGGWLHVPTAAGECAGCSARAVAAAHRGGLDTPLDAVTSGVLGSLVALAALDQVLGLPSGTAPLRWFAADTSLLAPLPWKRVAGCAACAGV